MLSVSHCPPTRGGEKGGKGREIHKLNMKTALLIALIILIILRIREIEQNTQNRYWSSLRCQAGTRKSQAGLHSRQELDSGVHGSESGSGLQAGQGAGSSSAAGHGGREQDPCDLPVLNWVRRAWHGVPCWPIPGPLSRPPFPASATLCDSSLARPKRSVGDLGCCSDNYKQQPFSGFRSYRWLSKTINTRCYLLWSRHCKICSQLQKNAVTT